MLCGYRLRMKNRVVFVCGLIGAGKTTWAKKQHGFVTDLDEFPQYSTKKDQIRQTKHLLRRGDVFHITCFPTKEELDSFKRSDCDFVYIATDPMQCKTNILIRNRKRDMEDLPRVFKANSEFKRKFELTELPFRKVKVMR